MNKAARELSTALAQVDVVLELLDARIPFSSANPMLTELRRNRPVVHVLTRSDLADPDRTDDWVRWYQQQQAGTTVALSAHKPNEVSHIVGPCRAAVSKRMKPILVMVVGIPNVGKSTLINTLARKAVAKTGNEPAITRQQQRVELGGDMALLDTPGVLWPNVENAMSGYRLAATGAIKETAYSHEVVAELLAEFLALHYPDQLRHRYGLEEFGIPGQGLLDALGRHCGCLGSGKVVNRDRAARILINDFRSGRLGKITLETPAMWEDERRELAGEQVANARRQIDSKSRLGHPTP